MSDDIHRPKRPAVPRAGFRAFAVHMLTASGVLWALLALLAATERDWVGMFLWLGVALAVDGIDGPLARMVSIKTALPRYDGETLDLVVDFLTYVFVPAYALAVSGLMPDGLGVVAATVICMTSAFYFADRGQKTEDNYFHGFPAVWNLVVFLLFVYDLPGPVAFAGVLVIAGLTFAPVDFVHPVRVVRWRVLTLAVCLGCVVLSGIALAYRFDPPGPVTALLTLCLAYCLGIGFTRTIIGKG